jgi:hypothetical protein
MTTQNSDNSEKGNAINLKDGQKTDKELADALWEALAELGIRDSLGGSEYRGEMIEEGRVSQFADAVKGLLKTLNRGRQ